jgi:hypothetical protein
MILVRLQAFGGGHFLRARSPIDSGSESLLQKADRSLCKMPAFGYYRRYFPNSPESDLLRVL